MNQLIPEFVIPLEKIIEPLGQGTVLRATVGSTRDCVGNPFFAIYFYVAIDRDRKHTSENPIAPSPLLRLFAAGR